MPPAVPPPTTATETPAVATSATTVTHEPAPADLVRDLLELPPPSDGVTSILPESLGATIESLRVGAEVPVERTIAEGGWGRAIVDPGTRVEVRFSGSTVTVGMQPGLRIDPVIGPDILVTQIRYDASTDRLDLDAEGFGPDALYRWAANHFANRYLLDLVPSELRTTSAPDAGDAAALHRAMTTLNNFGGVGVASGDGVALADPFGSATLRFTSTHETDLGDGYTLTIPRGARVTIGADLDGDADSLQLERIRVRASGPAITVAKSEGFMSGVSGLELHGLTVHHGGHVEADYDLQLEQAIGDGMSFLRVLVAVAGAHSGDPSGLADLHRPLPDPRLPALRADADAQLSAIAEPAIADWVRANDGVIEGQSLSEIMGIAPTGPQVP